MIFPAKNTVCTLYMNSSGQYQHRQHTPSLVLPHCDCSRLQLDAVRACSYLHSLGRCGFVRNGYMSSTLESTSPEAGIHSLSMRQFGGCLINQSESAASIQEQSIQEHKRAQIQSIQEHTRAEYTRAQSTEDSRGKYTRADTEGSKVHQNPAGSDAKSLPPNARGRDEAETATQGMQPMGQKLCVHIVQPVAWHESCSHTVCSTTHVLQTHGRTNDAPVTPHTLRRAESAGLNCERPSILQYSALEARVS